MVEQKDKNQQVQKRQMHGHKQKKERNKTASKQATFPQLRAKERRRKSQRERQLLNTDYGVKKREGG